MLHLRRIFLKFSCLFTNSRSEAELDREIAAHLSLLEDEFLNKGMSPEDARSAARRAYGGVEQAKQLHRNERSYQGLAQALQEARHAIRGLCKSPGFSATAILMLAFGIGATTAIFSIVEGVLLRPLPFPDPGRLVILADILQGADCNVCTQPGVTAPDIRNYMRDTHSFTHLGGFQGTGFELSGSGDPENIGAMRMSGEVFPALGVAPLLGHTFTQKDDEEHQQVAVLSYGLWKSHFHGDGKIVGTKIFLDRKPYIVIGVMPRNFEFPLVPGHLYRTELWVPMSFAPEEFTAGYAAAWNFRMVGRLKPGITTEQAQGDAERVAQETMRSYPAFMRSLRIHAVVRPLHEDTVEQARPLVRTLFLAVTVVLLIVCTNLAGLLLVRAIRRKREIAVRLALGARATAMLRQAIVESLVLSVTGGMMGLATATATIQIGVNLLPETLPRIREIGLDWPVVGFAMGLALITGLLCGLAPAFAAIRTNMNDALKEGGRTGTSGGGHSRLRATLVVAEIAVALVLLTASGLLLRSFEKMRAVDVGFRPDHTLAALYDLPKRQYGTQPGIDEFNDKLLRDIRQLPSVKAVGITSLLPAAGDDMGIALMPEGYVPPKGAGMNLAGVSLVQGDIFQALGIPLLSGRLFTEADKADSQLVVIVNRKLAEHYWPGQDPIGKRLRRGMPETLTPWLTVVGEVDDVKLGAPDGRTAEQIYEPTAQAIAAEGVFASAGEMSGTYGHIVVRTAEAPEQMENAIRAAVKNIDPQLPLFGMQTMEQTIADSEAPRRFNTALISSFAVVAVLLSVLGIYSVIAFSVAMREQEMAIRLALGSQVSTILALIVASGAKLAAAGCVLGLFGAVMTSRLLRSFLFGITPFDPVVLTFSVAAMLLLTLAASALAARRAVETDPMLALRGE
jgi:predicted permease